VKIVQFGIGAVTCVTLSACAQLLTVLQIPEGCYPVDTLDARQQMALHVGHGNPILLVGSQQFVCSCYRAGGDEKDSLRGFGEQGRLAGADEQGQLHGANEKGQLNGKGEQGLLAGANEKGQLTGNDEKQGSLAGRGEREGSLAGANEKGQLHGEAEQGQLNGTSEQGQLHGAKEEGHLAGSNEKGRLSGDFAKLSCRIVPECSGFQLIGYAPPQIMVLTASGQMSVPTNCITW
jgi:hypothetical protein